MRRSLLGLTALATVLLFTACEGPQGPAGAAGPAGPEGPAGPQGDDGADANANCSDCHSNDTYILARQLQYEGSQHAMTETFERGGALGPSYYAPCARCHTNEGFVDYIATPGDPAALIDNPTPINCRGCHLIHVTGTAADIALRTEAPVTLDLTMDQVDNGKGNLCTNCHQPRTSYAIPVVGGPDYEVTSEHWGPHLGAQSAVYAGVAGYEVAGSRTYPTSNFHNGPAEVEDACVTCHMGGPWSDQAGGHTMSMWYTYGGSENPLVDTCSEANCHGDDALAWTDFDYDGLQTEVETLLGQLEALLITAGALNDTDPEDVHPVEAAFSADVAGAMWNFFLIGNDHSKGVHNPRYAVALLTNSVEALTP